MKIRQANSNDIPLTKQHPYKKNDVFGFWESNGYTIAGDISWIVSPREKLECSFYRKDF